VGRLAVSQRSSDGSRRIRHGTGPCLDLLGLKANPRPRYTDAADNLPGRVPNGRRDAIDTVTPFAAVDRIAMSPDRFEFLVQAAAVVIVWSVNFLSCRAMVVVSCNVCASIAFPVATHHAGARPPTRV